MWTRSDRGVAGEAHRGVLVVHELHELTAPTLAEALEGL